MRERKEKRKNNRKRKKEKTFESLTLGGGSGGVLGRMLLGLLNGVLLHGGGHVGGRGLTGGLVALAGGDVLFFFEVVEVES